MDALIALTLLAAASGEPALAGGPEVRERREQTVHIVERRETRHGQGGVRIHYDPDAHGAVRAGDPVRLGPDFFAAPMAGGVERPVRVQVYGRRGAIVIRPHAPGPVSAGEAAAARGLPRG